MSLNKTWEGSVGGGTATLLGAASFNPWQAAGMSRVVNLLGFAVGLTMPAVKRDLGVKDDGTLIQGHGGMLDRVDSVRFADPAFFHLMPYYFT